MKSEKQEPKILLLLVTGCFVLFLMGVSFWFGQNYCTSNKNPIYYDDGRKCHFFPRTSPFSKKRRTLPKPSNENISFGSIEKVEILVEDIDMEIRKLSGQINDFLLTQTNLQNLEELKKKLETMLEEKVRVLNTKENELNNLHSQVRSQINELESCRSEKKSLKEKNSLLVSCVSLRKNHKKQGEKLVKCQDRLRKIEVGLVVMIKKRFWKIFIVLSTIAQILMVVLYGIKLYTFVIGEWDIDKKEGDPEKDNEIISLFYVLGKGIKHVTKFLVSVFTLTILILFVRTFLL